MYKKAKDILNIQCYMLMQKASCLNTEVSASLSPIPSWMNKVKSIFWQCDGEEDTVVTVTHMYEINEKT